MLKPHGGTKLLAGSVASMIRQIVKCGYSMSTISTAARQTDLREISLWSCQSELYHKRAQ
ncbi:Uncharacterised protein [Escherichia coli]|nr:Uncharacterised protein [Escherichia coli]